MDRSACGHDWGRASPAYVYPLRGHEFPRRRYANRHADAARHGAHLWRDRGSLVWPVARGSAIARAFGIRNQISRVEWWDGSSRKDRPVDTFINPSYVDPAPVTNLRDFF